MSQHPSFKTGGKSVKAKRSVLKRYERIDMLKKEGKLNAQSSSVFGLPKIKPEV